MDVAVVIFLIFGSLYFFYLFLPSRTRDVEDETQVLDGLIEEDSLILFDNQTGQSTRLYCVICGSRKVRMLDWTTFQCEHGHQFRLADGKKSPSPN